MSIIPMYIMSSNLEVEVTEKAVVDFVFSVVARLQSSPLLRNERLCC